MDPIERNLPSEPTDDTGKSLALENKEARRERQRQELLNHLAATELKSLRHKVAWLMNHHSDTRDSDRRLQIRFWETFQSDVYKGEPISLDAYYSLVPLTSIARERAHIQNDFRLFQASAGVRARRSALEEEEREKARADRVDYPVYAVYMDESGKGSSQLIVGSLWLLSSGTTPFTLYQKLDVVRKRLGGSKEFHFSDVSRADLPIYFELIDLFLSLGDSISLKVISVPNDGIRDQQEALFDLHYHLLVKGIQHEVLTRRAPLPRFLQVWKDAEQPGADKLTIANLKDKMQGAASTQFDGQLFPDLFDVVDSKGNVFLQMADLLAGCTNRVLSRTNTSAHQKDKLADYLMEHLQFNPKETLKEQVGDLIVHIRL